MRGFMINFIVTLLIFGLLQPGDAVVFDLDNDNFDETVNGAALVVVMFYAPWCSTCKKYLPVFSDTSSRFSLHNEVIFARVNAYMETILALRYDITGLPTVLYFPYSTEPTKYSDTIQVEPLRQFVRALVLKNEEHIKSGKKKRGEIPLNRPTVETKKEKNVHSIHVQDFRKVVQDRSKHAFVSFYGPGCKDDCYVFAQVAESFKNEDSLVFVKIDYTTDSRILNLYKIHRNPTFIWFPKSEKEYGARYGGGINAIEMVRFINFNAGTYREVGGTLMPDAGRIPALDDLLRKRIHDIVSGKRMGPVITQAKAEVQKTHHDKRYGEEYVRILQLIASGKPVDEAIQDCYDDINDRLEKVKTEKENEELTKIKNIIGAFVDTASNAVDEELSKKGQKTATLRQSHLKDEL